MTLAIPKFILLALIPWGIYALFGFGFASGSFDNFTAAVAKEELPGTGVSFRFDTSNALFNELSVLLVFFWPLLDGSTPDASLFGLYFLGQWTAILVMLFVESKRRAMGWKLPSFAATYALICQVASVGGTMPTWFLLHLLLAPTMNSAEDVLVDSVELAALPLSIIIGYLLPSLVMVLPCPSFLSYHQKSLAIMAGWQPFPVWIFIAQTILVQLFRLTQSPNQSIKEKKAASERGLKRVYAFGLAVAAAAHIACFSISGMAALFPQVFNPEFVSSLQPSRVFIPVAPYSGKKVTDLGEGALFFLQWDLYTGVLAALVWAIALRIQAKREHGTLGQWIRVWFYIAFLSVFVGPSGVALIALWSRDSLILKRDEGTEKKKN